jgi:hypothetical protein
MIRRGFWLAVGATGGILGYRRAAALGRQLSATLTPAAPRDGGGQAGQAGQAGSASARAATPLARKARRGLVRGTIRFSRDARMFSRDVREGMDLYLVRHRAQGSPTLGAGARSRRPAAPPPVVEVPGAPTAHDERVKDDR